MTNRPRQKGTAAETAVVRWLREHGHPGARRNPPAGAKDVGDIGGIIAPGQDDEYPDLQDHIVIEVKSYKDIAAGIRQGLAELEAEKANAGTTHGTLILKRRGTTDVGEWLSVRLVKDDPELNP